MMIYERKSSCEGDKSASGLLDGHNHCALAFYVSDPYLRGNILERNYRIRVSYDRHLTTHLAEELFQSFPT